jgi:predicted ATPase
MNGVDLELNPNLNCIIGGRGTGKSTLLELIRYAFDVQPKTETNDKQAQSLIKAPFPRDQR